jgi:hypothetical protein
MLARATADFKDAFSFKQQLFEHRSNSLSVVFASCGKGLDHL